MNDEQKEFLKKYFAEIGRKGGLSTSDKKKKSSAENGKLGGRPKKLPEQN